MAKVRINGVDYDAQVTGIVSAENWDGRSVKAVRLPLAYEEVKALFVDGVEWGIITETLTETVEELKDEDGNVIYDEDGNIIYVSRKEYTDQYFDNSAYCISGDITDHRDGTVSVLMGKLTDLEEVLEEIFGGYDD